MEVIIALAAIVIILSGATTFCLVFVTMFYGPAFEWLLAALEWFAYAVSIACIANGIGSD